MTNDAKAVAIAKKMVRNLEVLRRNGIDVDENGTWEDLHLGAAFLALSEKVKKLELLRIAAMNSPCRHSSDVTSASCSVCDALKQLREPGEADG